MLNFYKQLQKRQPVLIFRRPGGRSAVRSSGPVMSAHRSLALLGVLGMLGPWCTTAALPCLSLFRAKDSPEARCPEHAPTVPGAKPGEACSSPPLRVTLQRAELGPRGMLVGPNPSDAFPCYPLSDDDMWRSRRAVPGDLSRLKAFVRKARSGNPVKVVSLGGSVTNGGG